MTFFKNEEDRKQIDVLHNEVINAKLALNKATQELTSLVKSLVKAKDGTFVFISERDQEFLFAVDIIDNEGAYFLENSVENIEDAFFITLR